MDVSFAAWGGNSYQALADDEFEQLQDARIPRIQWRLCREGTREVDSTRSLTASTADLLKNRARVSMSFDIGRFHSTNKKSRKHRAEASCIKRLWSDFRKGRWTIIPEPRRKGRVFHWTDVWDILVYAATFFTVFYVPFDVVMYKHEGNHGRTIHNTLLIIFTIDMFFTFSLAYKVSSDTVGARDTQLWEVDPYMIAWRYVKPLPQGGYKSGWFLNDLLCVLPGLLEYVVRNWINGFENPRLEVASRLFLVARFVAPLLRPFLKKSSQTTRWDRLLERAHQEYGRSIVGGGRLANFVTMSAVICHLMACAWICVEGNLTFGLLSYHTEKQSWLSKLIEKRGDPCSPDVQTDHMCLYTLALYWSWTTLSSVGYGDITPMNHAEYICCTIIIIISYFLSAYVIGSFASLLSAFMDPHSVAFENDMKLLDNMMAARGISSQLKSRIRGYMYRSQGVVTMRAQAAFLENRKLSHGLQREVAQETIKNTELWAPVWWAAHLSDNVLLEMTRFLYPEFYAPHEDVFANGNFMLILRSGCAAYKGHVLLRGSSWGHESVLLTSPGLIDITPLKILSYVDALQLKKQDLQSICHRNFDADKWLRRVQIKTAVRRAFIRSASIIRESGSLAGVREHILDLENKHFSVVHDIPILRRLSNNEGSQPRGVAFSAGSINSAPEQSFSSLAPGLPTLGRVRTKTCLNLADIDSDGNLPVQDDLANTLHEVLRQQEDMALQLNIMLDVEGREARINGRLG